MRGLSKEKLEAMSEVQIQEYYLKLETKEHVEQLKSTKEGRDYIKLVNGGKE